MKAEREAAVKAEQRRREDELRRKKLEEEKAAARKVREERERKLAEEKARGKAPVQRVCALRRSRQSASPPYAILIGPSPSDSPVRALPRSISIL